MSGGQRVRAWLQLFRVPNLFTVPAEPVAGYFVATRSIDWAGVGVLPWVVGAAVAFYGAGLAWNDYFDRYRDYRVRLNRPIPAGWITPRAALWAGGVCALAGLLLCFQSGTASFWFGACLLACVFSYDRYFKRIPLLGALTMGLCRGFSVLLGASAAGFATTQGFGLSVWIVALMVTLYVASVTQVAKREAVPHNPGLEIWAPLLVLAVGMLLFIAHVPAAQRMPFGLAYAVALSVPFLFGIRLQGFVVTPNLPRTLERQQAIVHVLPPWIGWLIANLLLIHIAFILSTPHASRTVAVWVLAGCWLCNRVLSRRFYVS